MRVWVLGSGSSGNGLIVEAPDANGKNTRVWIDAGIGPRAAALRMRTLGADLFPRGADAILVTHEHGDHAAQLESVSRALGFPNRDHGEARIFLHDGIRSPRVRHRFAVGRLDVTKPLKIGSIVIEALPIPHDTDQVALRVSSGGASFAYATDLGCAPRGLASFLGACDAVFLEANYCPKLLAQGPYPPKLKQRVASAVGHLSNEQTAALVSDMSRYGRPRILLCHLSRVNNDPELARKVVSSASRLPVSVLPHGEPRIVDVVRTGPKQLALPFGA